MKWLKEWYMVIIPVFLFMTVCALPFIATSSKTTTVPTEFCKAQYTGQVRYEEIATTSCAAYDSNMNCTVPITNWSTGMRREVRTTCDWAEWY